MGGVKSVSMVLSDYYRDDRITKWTYGEAVSPRSHPPLRFTKSRVQAWTYMLHNKHPLPRVTEKRHAGSIEAVSLRFAVFDVVPNYVQ